MIGEYEQSQVISVKDVGRESSLVDIATVATMARSLDDEELAVLIEGYYDEVFSTIREATDDIDDLIEIFSQT